MQATVTQKKGRLRRGFLISLLITALLVGGYGLWAARWVHQARLNRLCKSAIEQNQIQRAIALVEAGADPNSYVQDGPSPPVWKLLWDRMCGRSASSNERESLYSSFVSSWGAISIFPNSFVLQDADATRLTETMLRHGADVNARTSEGNTALSQAVKVSFPETIKVLLTHGADINATNNDKTTPLIFAVNGRDLSTVRLLLMHDADVNLKRSDGVTALILACDFDENLAMVQELLNHHADPNYHNPNGAVYPNQDTALKQAEYWGGHKIVALLRKYGAKE